ncbi:hypothetical protein BH20ACI4_BH20ACI4_06310 [soil metagenome]
MKQKFLEVSKIQNGFSLIAVLIVLTSIVAGNNIYSNNLQPDTNIKTDMIAFAYRDLDFNVSDVIQLVNVNTPAGNPEIASLITKDADGAVNVRANDLYLIESDTSQVAVIATGTNGNNQIDISPTDALNLNQAMNGLNEDGSLLRECVDSTDQNCTTYLASVKRFFLVKYHVKEDGTLLRTVYGNNRNWIFDTTFLDPNRLPPGTPFFQSIQLTGFQRLN